MFLVQGAVIGLVGTLAGALFGWLIAVNFEAIIHGIEAVFVQENVGFSHRRGTMRGLHFQRRPHAEVKLVRCTRGAVWDS